VASPEGGSDYGVTTSLIDSNSATGHGHARGWCRTDFPVGVAFFFAPLTAMGFSKQLPGLFWAIAVRVPRNFWPLGRLRVGLIIETSVFLKLLRKHEIFQNPPNPFRAKREVSRWEGPTFFK
jgi:hypothetical protein